MKKRWWDYVSIVGKIFVLFTLLSFNIKTYPLGVIIAVCCAVIAVITLAIAGFMNAKYPK